MEIKEPILKEKLEPTKKIEEYTYNKKIDNITLKGYYPYTEIKDTLIESVNLEKTQKGICIFTCYKNKIVSSSDSGISINTF